MLMDMDGVCMTTGLCIGQCDVANSGKDLRTMFAAATSHDCQYRKTLMNVMRRKSFLEGMNHDLYSGMKNIDAYHVKVASPTMTRETWGDEIDVLLYSVITGIRVKILQNSKNGLICVQDTLEDLIAIKDVSLGDHLKISVSETSPVQILS